MPTPNLPTTVNGLRQHCACGQPATFRHAGSPCCESCYLIETRMNHTLVARTQDVRQTPTPGRNYCDRIYTFNGGLDGKVITRAPKV